MSKVRRLSSSGPVGREAGGFCLADRLSGTAGCFRTSLDFLALVVFTAGWGACNGAAIFSVRFNE